MIFEREDLKKLNKQLERVTIKTKEGLEVDFVQKAENAISPFYILIKEFNNMEEILERCNKESHQSIILELLKEGILKVRSKS